MPIIPTGHKAHKRNHTAGLAALYETAASSGGLMAQVPPSDVFTRRVCLRLDGMDEVTVRRDLAYGPHDSRKRMDVYYPRNHTDNSRWPAVIIVGGYPGTMESRPTTLTYKEIGWTVSMCQLIAVSG